MSFTDPYEEWKTKGRPGGSFEEWKKSQAQPTQSSTTQPSTTQPASTQPSATDQQLLNAPRMQNAQTNTGGSGGGGGGLLGGGGGLLGGAPASTAPASYPAPPPSTGTGTDPFAGQISMGERDTDNYSAPQWAVWEAEERQLRAQGKSASQLTPGGCPPAMPFTSRPGPDGKVECAFKPDDCPEGTRVFGSGSAARCVPSNQINASGGLSVGGGGGGGGTGGTGKISTGGPEPVEGGNVPDVTGQANALWQEIQNLQSRYSPEVMQTLMAAAKRQGSAAGASAKEKADLEATRRGMGRSIGSAQMSSEAARTAEASVVNPASSYYAAEKVKADQEDRISKLNAMQNWINSARQHIQSMAANRTQKEIALANLALAEKRLQQEVALQKQQMSQQLQLQQNEIDYGMAQRAYGGLGY